MWVELVIVGMAALIVLAEGLNKLERTDVRRGPCPRSRAAAWLRVVGWGALVLAAGGGIFLHILPPEYVEIGYILAITGSAALIVRARLEPPAQQHDAFDRTQMVRLPLREDA